MNNLLDYTLTRAPIILADAEGISTWAASRSLEITAALAAGKDSRGDDLPTPYYQSGVGVIPISGPLMKAPSKVELAFGFTSYTTLAETLATMSDTVGLKGIVLLMDSPGGDVAGIYEAADAIEGAGRKLRVETVVDGLCCSAAIWLASKTGRITASRSSTVGSVGVVLTHTSIARALRDRGVDVTLISDPSGKVAAHPYRALDEAGSKMLQERVAEIANEFREVVTTARPNLKAEALSGHTFSAARGKTLGLLDVVGETVNEVIRRLSAGAPAASPSPSAVSRLVMGRAAFDQLSHASQSAFCIAGGKIT